MYTLAFIFIFCLGMIIGSFLNVVIYRFNTGKTLGGRSICMTCSKQLRWYELIPVLSFLIQSGRCRGCAGKIAHQYPAVELATGLIFAFIAFHFSATALVSQATFIFLVTFFAFLFCLLIVIAAYDMRHKIIPDEFVYVFSFLALVSVFINHTGIGPLFIYPSVWAILAGPLCAVPFAILWLISRGKWMGLGDAKLILGLGWMLGVTQGLAMLMLAFWIGTIISLIVLFFGHIKLTMKTEIPFAPFLIFSTLIVFLYSIDVFTLAGSFHF